MSVLLRPVPLSRDGFSPFGAVISTDGGERFLINDGTTTRFHRLAPIDVEADGGRGIVSIFRARPRELPLEIRVMERHPLGSQAFIPLNGQRFLVVVAPPGETFRVSDLRAFVTDGRQGVSLARGTWHHPVIAFGAEADFLVIDRDGPGENLVETRPGGPREQVILVSTG